MTMSDDYDAPEQSPLEQFTGLFQTPTGQAFAQEAQIRLNDYLTKRSIADENTAAGEAFTSNLDTMRQNYMGAVQDDPSFTHTALDLAHLGVSAMVGSVPGADPRHLDTISTGMQQDIARAAVHTLADQHEGLARDLLDTPRISDLLEGEHKDLHEYITSQAIARHIDAQGAQKMAAQAANQRINDTAWGYMADMVDPDTGSIVHPPGWASKVMADPSLPSPLKAQLFDTYGRLQEQGDANASDPGVVGGVLRAVAGGTVAPAQILPLAGSDLRAADAVYLARLASDPTLAGRAGEISSTLNIAQQALAPPENGPAGQAAYADFSNWVLGNARGGADLDPRSQDYLLAGNRLQQFAPRASDNVDAVVQVPIQDRRPLHDIFGGGKRG